LVTTAIIYHEYGNVICTVVVGYDGNVSDHVVIKKPANGIVSIFPGTGVNTFVTLLVRMTLVIMSFKLQMM
jgi:hypothetical protein